MNKLAVAAALVALSGCTAEPEGPLVPRETDVARLEALLARHPCVGSLGEWERNYRLGYQAKTFWPGAFEPEFNLIQFRFRHTGPISIEPARNIVPLTDDHAWPDDPAVRKLSGIFNVRSGRLSMDRCRPAETAL